MREQRVDLGELSLHLVEAGPGTGASILFLHGWPQDHHAFGALMMSLQDQFRVAAIDLPGVGRSIGVPRRADKRNLASYVHALITAAELTDLTLVGHDIGGQIVYSYLRAFPGSIARAAILDVVIPGVPPWQEVIRNPSIWHFGFHAVSDLPETLVAGREHAYFDFFFDAIAANPAAISTDRRRLYGQAYATPDSLKAGFEWYRAFRQDAQDNASVASAPVATPVLYVRGGAESGELQTYLEGLRGAGITNLRGTLIPNCGHFSPEEQPAALADALRSFITASPASCRQR